MSPAFRDLTRTSPAGVRMRVPAAKHVEVEVVGVGVGEEVAGRNQNETGRQHRRLRALPIQRERRAGERARRQNIVAARGGKLRQRESAETVAVPVDGEGQRAARDGAGRVIDSQGRITECSGASGAGQSDVREGDGSNVVRHGLFPAVADVTLVDAPTASALYRYAKKDILSRAGRQRAGQSGEEVRDKPIAC